jgi:hypothetical protein
MTRRFDITQGKSAFLLVVNIVGICAYLWLVSFAWADPQERAMGIPITGEPFVWAAALLPIVAIFFPLNIGWGVLILVSRQWKSGRYWLLVAMLWLIAVVIDFAHH